MNAPEDFQTLTKKFFGLYEAEEFSQALRLLENQDMDFPCQAFRMAYWRMCVLCLMEQPEAALKVFDKAIDAGAWWSESLLRRDPDLKTLQDLPEFNRLTAISEERYQAEQALSKPGMAVALPDTPPPYPLVIVLHAQAGNAEEELARWMPMQQLGWMVASLQSVQLAFPGAHTWDDREKGQAQVLGQFKELCEHYPLDPEQFLVGGFSQGGALAIRLALNGSLPVRGFFSVCPGMIDHEKLLEWAFTPRPRPVRGYLVTGGRDPRHDFFLQLCQALPTRGVPCQMEDHPELGHEYPPDFDLSVQNALAFLMP